MNPQPYFRLKKGTEAFRCLKPYILNLKNSNPFKQANKFPKIKYNYSQAQAITSLCSLV